jgi:hypothetical protein
MEGIAELRALTRPKGVHRMYDVLTALLGYSEECMAEAVADFIVSETRAATGRSGFSEKWDALNQQAEYLAEHIRKTYGHKEEE